MTQYRARVSFFSSGGRHFNQGDILDTTTYFNLNSTDQGMIDVETVADKTPIGPVPSGPAMNIPSERHMHPLGTADEKQTKEVPLSTATPLVGAGQSNSGLGKSSDRWLPLDPSAAHESLLAKIEHGFEQFGHKVFSELQAIKDAVLKFVEGPHAPSDSKANVAKAPQVEREAPEEEPAPASPSEVSAGPSSASEGPEEKPAPPVTTGEAATT